MNTLKSESAKLVAYGFRLMPQERFNETIEAFRQAIELEKDSLLAHQGRALCYTLFLDGDISDKEKVDHAASDLEQALNSARRFSEDLS